jgi:hypothetical protein
MRAKQLELRDSGLLPEKMRMRRAGANNMTIYEMVRDETLYPLETYLDAADLALERNAANLQKLKTWLTDKDDGMRYWGIVGLFLLEKGAETAAENIEKALKDPAPEVQIMAAWSLVRLGRKDKGLGHLRTMLFEGCANTMLLHNVLSWMGEPAFALIKDFSTSKPNFYRGKYGTSILGHVIKINKL